MVNRKSFFPRKHRFFFITTQLFITTHNFCDFIINHVTTDYSEVEWLQDQERKKCIWWFWWWNWQFRKTFYYILLIFLLLHFKKIFFLRIRESLFPRNCLKWINCESLFPRTSLNIFNRKSFFPRKHKNFAVFSYRESFWH